MPYIYADNSVEDTFIQNWPQIGTNDTIMSLAENHCRDFGIQTDCYREKYLIAKSKFSGKPDSNVYSIVIFAPFDSDLIYHKN